MVWETLKKFNDCDFKAKCLTSKTCASPWPCKRQECIPWWLPWQHSASLCRSWSLVRRNYQSSADLKAAQYDTGWQQGHKEKKRYPVLTPKYCQSMSKMLILSNRKATWLTLTPSLPLAFWICGLDDNPFFGHLCVVRPHESVKRLDNGLPHSSTCHWILPTKGVLICPAVMSHHAHVNPLQGCQRRNHCCSDVLANGICHKSCLAVLLIQSWQGKQRSEQSTCICLNANGGSMLSHQCPPESQGISKQLENSSEVTGKSGWIWWWESSSIYSLIQDKKCLTHTKPHQFARKNTFHTITTLQLSISWSDRAGHDGLLNTVSSANNGLGNANDDIWLSTVTRPWLKHHNKNYMSLLELKFTFNCKSRDSLKQMLWVNQATRGFLDQTAIDE